MGVIERFRIHVTSSDESTACPFFMDNGTTFCYITVNNLYFVGVTRRNANAMMIVTFLYKLAGVLKSYFESVEEEAIKDNFSITYELLDEVMDHGYPQITDSSILHEYIKSEAQKLTVDKVQTSSAVTNLVSWRREGIKYPKNEVFLDVIEKVNLLVSSSGSVVRSEILGTLKMKSLLSGMPELRLGLNDRALLDAVNKERSQRPGSARPVSFRPVDLDDVRFHQCVRLARFDADRTISFIPPDGEFELMSYRMAAQHIKPLISVEAVITNHTESKLEFAVKLKSQFKVRSVANSVEILVPLPPDVQRPQLKTSMGMGAARYHPDKDAIVWTIPQLEALKEGLMTASFSLPSVASEQRDHFKRKPVSVKFEIPYFVVSGLTVRYLRITEKSGYSAMPWVRHITQNGDYEFRLIDNSNNKNVAGASA
eukprot:GDKK01046352.1.p1 GENE.GDKK01046352.1~~GDKK01046352.1.p1  ORF type:complete len:462 (+),score=96.50 GDKK01046352.1:109-1386(+)